MTTIASFPLRKSHLERLFSAKSKRPTVKGPGNYLSLLVNRARMEGIVVFDYAARYPEGVAALAKWIKECTFKSREDVVDGLEHPPDALLMLFEEKTSASSWGSRSVLLEVFACSSIGN